MYRYALLNLAFLLAAGLLVFWLRWPKFRRLTILLGIMVVLTTIFDNLLIHFDIMVYTEAYISGLKIVLAPLEDFAYTAVAAVLMPLIWVKLRDK